MGSAAAKERFEKAEKTKILTAHELELSNWEKLTDRMKKLKGLRSANLSHNKFEGGIPPLFVTDCVFATLKVLDLSFNALTCVDMLSPFGGRTTTAGTKKSASKEKEGKAAPTTQYPPVAELLAMSQEALAGPSYPLETLNLSHNKLTVLPPFFLAQFKSVKNLDLSSNAIDLKQEHSSTVFLSMTLLTSLDLSQNNVTALPFPFPPLTGGGPSPPQPAGGAKVARPLGKLGTLNIEANWIKMFSLCGERFASLQSINIKNQRGGGLEGIDPRVYSDCPKLNSVDFDGSKVPKKDIVHTLKETEEYRAWESKHASVVDRQLYGTASAKLMD